MWESNPALTLQRKNKTASRNNPPPPSEKAIPQLVGRSPPACGSTNNRTEEVPHSIYLRSTVDDKNSCETLTDAIGGSLGPQALTALRSMPSTRGGEHYPTRKAAQEKRRCIDAPTRARMNKCDEVVFSGHLFYCCFCGCFWFCFRFCLFFFLPGLAFDAKSIWRSVTRGDRFI